MQVRIGWITVCIVLGLVYGAMAEQPFHELLGKWEYIGTGCSPCKLDIESATPEGKLVTHATWANEPVESWGQATRKGKKISVVITMAGGTSLEVDLSKNGKKLQGYHKYRPEESIGMLVIYERVDSRKK